MATETGKHVTEHTAEWKIEFNGDLSKLPEIKDQIDLHMRVALGKTAVACHRTKGATRFTVQFRCSIEREKTDD